MLGVRNVLILGYNSLSMFENIYCKYSNPNIWLPFIIVGMVIGKNITFWTWDQYYYYVYYIPSLLFIYSFIYI